MKSGNTFYFSLGVTKTDHADVTNMLLNALQNHSHCHTNSRQSNWQTFHHLLLFSL